MRSPRLLTAALSVYAVKLARLERREGVENCRHERVEMHHAVGGRTDK
jgi:hypothetical protein